MRSVFIESERDFLYDNEKAFWYIMLYFSAPFAFISFVLLHCVFCSIIFFYLLISFPLFFFFSFFCSFLLFFRFFSFTIKNFLPVYITSSVALYERSKLYVRIYLMFTNVLIWEFTGDLRTEHIEQLRVISNEEHICLGREDFQLWQMLNDGQRHHL